MITVSEVYVGDVIFEANEFGAYNLFCEVLSWKNCQIDRGLLDKAWSEWFACPLVSQAPLLISTKAQDTYRVFLHLFLRDGVLYATPDDALQIPAECSSGETWIKCSERLPNCHERVLLTNPNGIPQIGHLVNSRMLFWNIDSADHQLLPVSAYTYWAPAPCSPTE